MTQHTSHDHDNYSLSQFIEKARSAHVSNLPEKSKDGNPCHLPPWLDPNAVREGREFVRKHFFLIVFTHFLSLILLLSYVPVQLVLLKTGKSHTKKLALIRYLSTVSHVKLWYESDLSNVDSEAVRDVLKIRQIHAGVSKRMEMKPPCDGAYQQQSQAISDINGNNNDPGEKATKLIKALKSFRNLDCNNNAQTIFYRKEENNYPAWITQLDMIVTQYCFMGLLTSFPEKFGVDVKEDMKGLRGLTHIWAVVGHLLGIEEEFNLCVGDKTKEKQFILNEILLRDLFNAKEACYQLWDALVSAMSIFVPFLQLRSELLYLLDHIMEFKGMSLYNDASFSEKLDYKVKLVVRYFYQPYGIRAGLNAYLRVAIFFMCLWLKIQQKFLK